MSARNPLLAAPPHAVSDALTRLGRHLKLARVRRGLTQSEVAEKIGAGLRAVADAERGKPSTAIAIYAGLLWALGLMRDLDQLADPRRDVEGQTLAGRRERVRGGARGGVDNDF